MAISTSQLKMYLQIIASSLVVLVFVMVMIIGLKFLNAFLLWVKEIGEEEKKKKMKKEKKQKEI